jgi:hypothetical protein
MIGTNSAAGFEPDQAELRLEKCQKLRYASGV